jgi:hypothetical protein
MRTIVHIEALEHLEHTTRPNSESYGYKLNTGHGNLGKRISSVGIGANRPQSFQVTCTLTPWLNMVKLFIKVAIY